MFWENFIHDIVFNPPAWIISLIISILAMIPITYVLKFVIPGKSPEDKLTFSLEMMLSFLLFVLTFHTMMEYFLHSDKISPYGNFYMPALFAVATLLSIKQFRSTSKESEIENKKKNKKR